MAQILEKPVDIEPEPGPRGRPTVVAPVLPFPGGAPAPAPDIAPEDWPAIRAALSATARQRNGDAAARHTEIRRRLRALARAARTLLR
jgi:hypothetical protein